MTRPLLISKKGHQHILHAAAFQQKKPRRQRKSGQQGEQVAAH